MDLPRIMQPAQFYSEEDYPQALKFTDQQMSIFWLPNELDLAKDEQDLRVHLTAAELHGVTTVLKLFTRYELLVGSEYWGGTIARSFPRTEIQAMAALFSAMELSVHARFYNRVNAIMNLDSEDFFMSYTHDPDLVERMDFVTGHLYHEDVAVSLAAFAFVEGAILYSSFAFLRAFQDNGRDLLKNLAAGVRFSAQDEGLHSEAGAWLFRTVMEESGRAVSELTEVVNAITDTVERHEFLIIDKLFERGPILGVTPDDLKNFVQHRVNVVLKSLGYPAKHPDLVECRLVNSFYIGMQSYGMNDFFVSVGNEYDRSVDESALGW